jgi:uncharacterized phage-like protein YoqJ
MVCAFSGHRPQNLPWGEDEEDQRCLALKKMISDAVEQLADRGCTEFLCGMARGCDCYFAEAVLRLRDEKRPELRFVAVTPCPSQPSRWRPADRARYEALLLAADEVRIMEKTYSPGCMLRRNRAMVDAADVLLTVYDGGKGGTAAAVRYAAAAGVEIVSLWR